MISMNKEYRQELKILRKAKRKILSDDKQAQRVFKRDINAIVRTAQRSQKRVSKELGRIEKREAILEGRLS